MGQMTSRARGSRGMPARWLASFGVVVSLLVGAVAAPSASAAGTQTGTIWIPLVCNLGAVVVNVGAAFTATVPTSVTPGEEFNLQNAVATIELPAGAVNGAAFAFGNPSEVEGAVQTFDTNLTNAIAPTLVSADTTRTDGGAGTWGPDMGFASSDPNIGAPTGSPAVVNLVAAAQPPNADAPSPLDPLINGPSPLAGFPDYPETPLEGVFSWGPAPVDGSGNDGTSGGNPTTNSYAPAPGTGGGTVPVSGTPDPASGGPIEVTGNPGQSVNLGIGNPSDLIKIGKGNYEFAVNNDLFFFERTGTLANQWSADTQVQCGLDTTTGAVPTPDPSYLPVSRGISIPIVSGSTTTTTSTTPTTTTTTTSTTTTTTSTTTTTTTTPTTSSTTSTTTSSTSTGGTAPKILAVFPRSGGAGSLVFIVGSNLSGATKVDFGTSAAQFLSLGSSFVLATVPANTSSGKTVNVTITTKAGTSPTTPADVFTYSHGGLFGGL